MSHDTLAGTFIIGAKFDAMTQKSIRFISHPARVGPGPRHADRVLLWQLLLGVLLLFAWGPLAAGQRPNVLVVLVDDMGWSDISPYGGEIHTPTLARLAANGLRFRHFHNEARCSPTRMALLTGLRMQTAGVDPNASLPNLRTDNNATLAELLGNNGYRTYFAGKWHLGALANARDPISRGFQHAFGQGPNADGAGNDYWALGFTYNLVSSNNEITPTNYPPGTFYKTDADADYVLKFLDHHYGKQDGKPFFIYLACNAPHFRLQAPLEYINQYTDVGDTNNPADADVYRYEEGWDLTRQRRYERQLAQGILEEHCRLSPKDYENVGKLDIPAWDSLTQNRRNDLARRMAVYAAMVHKVDENLDRVVRRLEAAGELDNTLIFFFADNGGNSEGGLYGRTAEQNNASPLTGGALEAMGLPEGELLHLGGGWANVNNTPLRFFKHHTHEGGCRTPLIVHWPRGMSNSVVGKWTNERGHAVDIMATVLDATGIPYPATFKGRTLAPLAGTSLRPLLAGGHLAPRDLFIEHENNRAMFRGPWKLVTKSFTQGGDDLPAHQLELYNLDTDPTEMNSVAFYNTALLSNMITAWNAWVDSQPGLDPNRKLTGITVDQSRFAMPAGDELLHDTFNRADAADVDAERGGLSGTLIGMNLAPTNAIYYQGFGSNRTAIVNGRLRMAISSAGMSESGLMINFIDPAIIKAGGFSVELTVTELKSAASEATDRYAGFGVGLTQAEAAAGADIGNPGSFRGRTTLTNGLADFFVELDLTGCVKVWSKGLLLESISVGRTNGTLLAGFALGSGFQTGDPVEVNVFFDGELLDINSADAAKTSRTFTWENTDANYIGLSVRATGYGELENLIIRPFPLRHALSAQHALDSGLWGSNTSREADPDGDGLNTQAEWLWGTDPALADAPLATVALTRDAASQEFRLRHRRLKHEDLFGVAYPIRFTVALSGPMPEWSEISVPASHAIPIGNRPQHEWVERPLPASLTATAAALFFQVGGRLH